MKRLKTYLPLLIFVLITVSCQAQSEKNEDGTSLRADDEISVYYFHFTRRCVTCKAIESESIKALETLYPNQYNSGQITFQSFNLDESDTKSKADAYKVTGQALLIVNVEKIIDLTNQAFMYARSNPAKLHAEIEKAIGEF